MSRSTAKGPRLRPRVALLIETSNAYARGLLHGIVAYIREHEHWSFYLLEQGRGALPPNWLSQWKGDGIIARIESRRIARAVVNLGIPMVDVSAGRHVASIPWVETDDAAIADLALEHFLERGFRHFAYCGDDRFNWSRWREESFVRKVEAMGYACHVLSPDGQRSDRQIAEIEQWLKALPKPLAVLACYDIRGQQILDACRNAELAVPDEVAVLGVDNDELLCELASPRLSSVVPDSRHTGYEAATLLAKIMKGERPAVTEIRIAPLGIEKRQSTDALAIDDPTVVEAVRFIREHACEAIHVPDVLRTMPLSRKVLEKRFRERLGHTVREEIMRVRIERVKRLLVDTDLALAEIAVRAGFEHPEYLSVVFKRETGNTPGEFRRTHVPNRYTMRSRQ